MNQTIFYSLIAGVSSLLGLIISYYSHSFIKKYSIYIITITSAILLSISFLHLIPEAININNSVNTSLCILIGFTAFYLIENFITLHACQEENECHNHSIGYTSALGLFLHSAFDGLAIAIGFEISDSIGIVTAIAVILHELPEGIFTYSILTHSHLQKKTALYLTICVALATPIFAIIGFFIFTELSTLILGTLLALTSGIFIYISASDLLPQTHKNTSIWNIIIFSCTIILIYLTSQ